MHIVCSNEARNGKSLFARIYADTLDLKGGETLRIFDTDHPSGKLADWYPGRAEIVDLSRTAGQVRLFDTIIGEPQFNYVVDLQAELLDRFFTIFHDIAFDQGAREAGIGVAVFFILDRSISSIAAAQSVRDRLGGSEFVIVRNEAIGNLLHLPSAAEAYLGIDKNRDLTMPRLSARALGVIDAPGFSFSGFIAGESEKVAVESRFEILDFLEALYNQRRPGVSRTTLAI